MGSSKIKDITGDSDFDELLDKCSSILKTKALDYATDNDRLAELRATAESIGTDMRKVLGVYMSKHYRSIFKWLRGEELRGEPIEEKLVDNIVYSLIAYKLVKEERKKRSQTTLNIIKEKSALDVYSESDYQTCNHCKKMLFPGEVYSRGDNTPLCFACFDV